MAEGEPAASLFIIEEGGVEVKRWKKKLSQSSTDWGSMPPSSRLLPTPAPAANGLPGHCSAPAATGWSNGAPAANSAPLPPGPGQPGADGDRDIEILVLYGNNAVVGEMELLKGDGATRISTVTATERVKAKELAFGDLMALFNGNSQLGLKVMTNIARVWMTHIESQLQSASYCNAALDCRPSRPDSSNTSPGALKFRQAAVPSAPSAML